MDCAVERRGGGGETGVEGRGGEGSGTRLAGVELGYSRDV